MKIIKEDLFSLELGHIVTIRQYERETDNLSISLYRVFEDGYSVKCEDIIAVYHFIEADLYYRLDSDECREAIENPDLFVQQLASAWAEGLIDSRIERFRWKLLTPEIQAVQRGHTGPVIILIVHDECPGQWCPMEFFTEGAEVKVFSKLSGAIKQLLQLFKYEEQYGAIGPSYYILEA